MNQPATRLRTRFLIPALVVTDADYLGEVINDDAYKPLPEDKKMTTPHPCTAENTALIAQRIMGDVTVHHQSFKAKIAKIPNVRLAPGDGGTPLRDFVPTNPLDEWHDVSQEMGLAVMHLASQGKIDLIMLDGKHYARPAA